MSTLATNAITDASGGNTATINGYTPTMSNMAGRNRLINSDMRIDQRNAGAVVTNNGYAVDRFLGFRDGSTVALTFQQSTTAPAGFVNSMVVTTTTSGTAGSGEGVGFQQRIEGLNISDLGWGTANAKTVTLSFWVRSSLTGTFSGSLGNSAFNRSYPYTYTISSANTWEQKSITIAGDTTGTWLTTNGIGIRVYWDMGSGTSLKGTAGSWASSGYVGATGTTNLVGTNGATFYITGVQLEVGSVATPFENVDYSEMLRRCQRYYWQSFTTGAPQSTPIVPILTANAERFGLPISQVQMRATPTAISFNASGTAGFVTEFSSGISRTISSINPSYAGGGGYAQTTVSPTNSIQVAVSYSAEL